LRLEHHVNTRVFRNAKSKSQWKLPVTAQFEIDADSFSTWRVRKVMDNLGTMVEMLLNDWNPNRVVLWQEMLQKYLDVMRLAFQHEDFSDEDIESFQDAVNEWYYKYFELVGLPGITNYVHLLGAGHLYHFLKKWRNLNRISSSGGRRKMVLLLCLLIKGQEKVMPEVHMGQHTPHESCL
jgi:hypothetical protein